MSFSALDWTFGLGISFAVIFAGASEWTEMSHPSSTFEKVCNEMSGKREQMSFFTDEERKEHCACITSHLKDDVKADTVNYTSMINWMSFDNPDEHLNMEHEFSQQSLEMFDAAYEQCVPADQRNKTDI